MNDEENIGDQKVPARMPRATWRFKSFLFLSSTFLGLALVEVGSRQFVDIVDWRSMPRFNANQCLQPDDELVVVPAVDTMVEYPRFGVSFRTNCRGFRGADHPQERIEGLRRVVVLGDSMAWGHGVGEGYSFAEVLERTLPRCEIINLGVPGYDLPREARYYFRKGRAYSPDIVLLVVCQNDFSAALAAEPFTVRSTPHAASAVQPGLLERFKDVMATHSAAYCVLRDAVNANKSMARAAVWLRLKDELGGIETLDDSVHSALREPPARVRRSEERFHEELLLFNDVLQQAGTKLLLGLIPARQAIDPEELVATTAYTQFVPDDFDLDRPYRRLSEFAREHGIAVSCALTALRVAHANGSDVYLPRDVHLNEKGHRLFAQTVRPALQRILDECEPVTSPACRDLIAIDLKRD